MTASKSITLFENEDYSVRLEYSKEFAILHLPYTNKMTKGVLLDMKFKLEDWLEFFTTAGYDGMWCAVAPDDDKIQRLITLLKFKYMGKADNMLVYKYGE
jgi:hypothetical protein